MNFQKKYDLAVIGGGPAGMLAAGVAAQSGAKIILLEKNESLGKKLLITGKGRCNITQDEYDKRKFIEQFGKNGKFFYSALSLFSVESTIAFFNKLGVKTKVERGGRVFPVSDKAGDVLKALEQFMQVNGVTVKTKINVKELIVQDGKIAKLLTNQGELIAEKYLVCTGGLSYPTTGSSGDGYKWLTKLGHTIVPLTPALTPLLTAELWVKELQGLSLKNVNLALWQNNKKQAEQFGEALFTHEGLSGPIVLDLSKQAGELLQTGKVEARLDFKPALTFPQLDQRLQRDFVKYHNKQFKNALVDLLPQKLIPVIIELSGIAPDKPINTLLKEERKKLIHLLKELPLTIKGLTGFNKAIITSGGVALKEIDPKTMCSKIIENLYLAGEILDLDGPTGGYNLQVCWSTGYAAGLASNANKLKA